MTPRFRLAPAALLLVGAALSGCTTFASLNSAARNLDAYELHPLPSQGAIRPAGRSVFVADPSVTGALGSERIVIKPKPLQVAFLPDGRWVEATPQMVRNLLARSLANSGRLGLVSTNTVGPLPDYTVMTDIETFQAEVGSPSGAPARVVVVMTISIARDVDGRLIAARRFSQTADATGKDADEIAQAFDATMTVILREATNWSVGVMTGSVPRV